MTRLALLAASTLCLAQAATAQDGLYYGLGVGVMQERTHAPIVDEFHASATDFALALTAGYRFSGPQQLVFGLEGNLDLPGGATLKGPFDTCTGESPTWCSLDAVLRLRSTLTADLSGGALTSSLGMVVVRGTAENGPGNNVSTTGTGMSFGLSWAPDTMPVRFDLNYDAVRSDNRPQYDRELNLVGLRVSYMF